MGPHNSWRAERVVGSISLGVCQTSSIGSVQFRCSRNTCCVMGSATAITKRHQHGRVIGIDTYGMLIAASCHIMVKSKLGQSCCSIGLQLSAL